MPIFLVTMSRGIREGEVGLFLLLLGSSALAMRNDKAPI